MARGLSHYSKEELEAELKKRGEVSTPVPLTVNDWEALKKLVIEGTNEMFKNRYKGDDFEHYIYEAAIEAVYGNGVWDDINAVLR